MYSSISVSEPCPETTTEHADKDSTEDLTPLNLSTKNKDIERSPSDHKLMCAEKLKGDELPLNLSLRASHSSPVHSSALNTAEDLQHRAEIEFNEEPCDQRQTAALALCQLAIASSAASSSDLSTAERPPNDSLDATNPGPPEKTKHIKSKELKRAKSGQADNNCNKPNKRAKAPGRVLRRRLRCC